RQAWSQIHLESGRMLAPAHLAERDRGVADGFARLRDTAVNVRYAARKYRRLRACRLLLHRQCQLPFVRAMRQVTPAAARPACGPRGSIESAVRRTRFHGCRLRPT